MTNEIARIHLLGLDDRFVENGGKKVSFMVHFPDTGEGKTLHTSTQRTQVRRELIRKEFEKERLRSVSKIVQCDACALDET